MIRVYLNSGSGDIDYTNYVTTGSIQINRSINAPSTCSMTLTNNDAAFILPRARAYLTIRSTKYNKILFTGFLQNDPSTSFVGMNRMVPRTGNRMYSFALNFTSDEYLLNIKQIDFMPPFVNQTQGSILRRLAEALCPGYFNFDNCSDGDIVPYLAYDSSKTWSQIAKSFGDASRYRYSIVNRQIIYQPYGDADLGIVYDETLGEGTFDPSALSTSSMTSPLINDVTIVGQQEAGNNREDYFIGDGFTGAFPLEHKVYGLDTAQNGSGLLLLDQWSGTTLSTQTWQAQDPGNNFYYGAAGSNALNILTGDLQEPGTSFIAAQNGLELAAGLNMQHGEFVFNDVCEGIVGGVFDSEILNGYGDLAINEASIEAGYRISPTNNVSVSASGASGIKIQPYRLGKVPTTAFSIITQFNKSYVLNTKITAPTANRYGQVFRTIAGVAYNALYDTEIRGLITWSVTETDMFTGVQTFYTFSEQDQVLPANAIYVLIDNKRLNLTVQSTQISTPIPASLNVKCEIGAGLLSPIYISGHVQYTGAFVTPSGGNLPIMPDAFGPENTFSLGSGINTNAAELDSGTAVDTLNFYGDDMPGVGTRIRLQTFESQAAISRLRDTSSIAEEAFVVKDDGIRSALVKNLSPLPRTSEDCDAAAQAFLADSVATQYQGTYNASSIFFNQHTDDIDFYPICGRFLYVNSPDRNIIRNFLVTAITTTVTEQAGEVLNHAISFGYDKQIEKLLATFVPVTSNLLSPMDTAIAVPPINLAQLGTAYLPDVQMSTISSMISGGQVAIDLIDALPPFAYFEVRNADENWGYKDARLISSFYATGTYVLPRTTYDQTWYARMVSLPDVSGNFSTSRRTKVLRVVYPRVPTPPLLSIGQSDRLQYDFTGDVRNICGIELRSGDRETVYVQSIVGSQEDMNFDLNMLRGSNLLGYSLSGNLGVHQFNFAPADQRDFSARFFNLMWEFGDSTDTHIPPPAAPTIDLGYRFGPSVEVRVSLASPRNDIKYTRLQLATEYQFTNIVIDTESAGFQSLMTSQVPVTSDYYARVQLVDYVSAGDWSNIVQVPLGNLIASDYLVGQASIPPAITAIAGTAGALFTYTSTPDRITIESFPFSILWPNQFQTNVSAQTASFTNALDSPGNLFPSTPYGFFPRLMYPTMPGPGLVFGGPYLNYTVDAFASQYQDGAVPLSTTAVVCQTAAGITGTAGGSGGGTGGGDTCGVLSSSIALANGKYTTLEKLRVGDRVKTFNNTTSVVKLRTVLTADTYCIRLKNGMKTCVALSHTLYHRGKWLPLDAVFELLLDSVDIKVLTEVGYVGIDWIEYNELTKICRIELEGDTDDEHIYNLDGLWTHNLIKGGTGTYGSDYGTYQPDPYSTY